MFIDTHAHVYSSEYSDINKVIKNAIEKNVSIIFDCAEDIKSLNEIIQISKKHLHIIYPIGGIHPLNINNESVKDLKILEGILQSNVLLGIGEIGLDYYYSKKDKDFQKEIFEKQLKLSVKYKLPVIIHSRDATEDTINILKKYDVKGIIHCFSGSIETAKKYISMGFLIGVGGVLTFKNSKLKEVIAKIDLCNLVLETDSPFLTPDPYRSQKNEPQYIPIIASKLAEIKNVEVEEVARITSQNVHTIFDF